MSSSDAPTWTTTPTATRYANRLGERVQRELVAFADFGYRFATDSLIPRLATEVTGAHRRGRTT